MKYNEPKILKERKERKKQIKLFWIVFLFEGGLFFITSLLSIINAFKLNILVIDKKIYLPTLSLKDFIFSFLLITFFICLFIFVKKASKFKEFVYKGLFILTCFWGGMAILNIWLPTFFAIFIIGGLIALWVERPSVLIHNIIMVLGLSGAASFFGLGFKPNIIVMLLLVFSFYDFIAVYKTKHMIAMAKDMIEKRVILGFIIPREAKGFLEKLSKVKTGGDFMIIGGGDVVLPGLLAVSLIPFGFIKAFVVVIFSLLGSFLTYWLFTKQKEKEPIPALPPIALFAIAGYFITLLF